VKRPVSVRIWLSRLRSTPVRSERIHEIASALPTHLDAVATRVSLESESVRQASADVLAELAGTSHRLAHTEHEVELLRGEVGELRREAGELQREVGELRREVGELRREAGAAGHRIDAFGHDVRAVGQELTEARREIALAHAAAVSSGHATRIVGEIAAAASRDHAYQQLLGTLGPPGRRVDGLSVLVITWNHAGWLPEALASARAVLAALPAAAAGQILVFDDASTDETGRVLDGLADDPDVRVIRSTTNLNLARGRNTLLAACPTRHALILDADNHALPEGAAEVYAVAAALGSTIAYGQVIAATDDGSFWAPFAYAPSRESTSVGHSFDSMAVIDVDAVSALGGYATDPQLGGWVDDLELLLRSLRRGGLLAYVPTVLGRYRLSPLRHSSQVTDQPALERRVARSHLYDAPDFDDFAIVAAHAGVGVLWASPGAKPFLDRADAAWRASAAGTSRHATRTTGPRVLVVAPGGVGNVGDDAISEAVVRRVRDRWATALIEVVSDRSMPVIDGPATPWSGTVVETWQGTNGLDLGGFELAVFAGGGNLATAFAPALLVPRCDIARQLASHGVPVIWSGQGIGPCSGDELELVIGAARTARAFGCRDAGSVESIRARSGNGPATVELVGDDAMAGPRADRARLDARLRAAEMTTERFVVLHARLAGYAGTTSADHVARLAEAIDTYAFRRGATVVGLATNDNEPHEALVLAALAQRAPRRSPWRIVDVVGDPPLARSVVAAAEAVVSHSYHVALWALEAGTPAVLVTRSAYYEAKAEGLRALAGLTAPIALADDPDADTLERHLDAVGRELDPSVLAAVADGVNAWWDRVLA
jgi:polysaccharide pyruvyl transferase WcaK-like protein